MTTIRSWLGKIYVGLMCKITPRCHEMTRLISAEQEKPHSLITRLRMRWHYGICVWCERYRDQLAFLGKLSRLFPEKSCDHGPTQLDEPAKTRIKQALRRELHD